MSEITSLLIKIIVTALITLSLAVGLAFYFDARNALKRIHDWVIPDNENWVVTGGVTDDIETAKSALNVMLVLLFMCFAAWFLYVLYAPCDP